MLSRGDLERSLSTLSDALAADGYRLESRLESNILSLRIVATDNACSDCLVPKYVMKTLVQSALRKEGITTSDVVINLTYPGDG